MALNTSVEYTLAQLEQILNTVSFFRCSKSMIINIDKVAKGAANVTLVGALLTCIPGAVMHFTCTSMLWYFVKSGATKEAHDIMLS